MIENLIGYPEVEPPDYSSRLTVQQAIEAVRFPTELFYEIRPTGRKRIIIEGESELVDSIMAAARPVLDEIRSEIG